MSETTSTTPLILFKTLRNTELGAEGVSLEDDGTVVFHGVLKKVTEGMLTSYPRSLLGHWLPNRLSVRYTRDQLAERAVRRFDSGEELDFDGISALAS